MKLQKPDPRPRPLGHLTLLGDPAAPALTTREGALDFAGLEAAVGRLAAALRARGLARGDRVASWLPKNRLTSLLPLACARAGLIHVPVNPLLKRAQVGHILGDSGAGLLISGEARLATLEPGDAACATAGEAESAALFDFADALGPSDEDPDDLAALLYTSGSTGRPKGVMLSHANMWLGALSVAHYLRLTADDRVLAVLPLSFDYGQNQLLSAWAAGASAVPLDYLAARDVIRAVERHQISTLAGVPPLWVQLIEAAWPAAAALSLRRLTNSGGKLRPPSFAGCGALPRRDIYSMYGLTEAFRSTYLEPASRFASRFDGRRIRSRRSCGRCRRRDAQEANSSMPGRWSPGAIGGIRRAPSSGSSRAPRAPLWRHGRLVGRPRPPRPRRLALFRGPRGRMIKTSGNRVSPTEVEEAALASGLVAEAVALGFPTRGWGRGSRWSSAPTGAARRRRCAPS